VKKTHQEWEQKLIWPVQQDEPPVPPLPGYLERKLKVPMEIQLHQWAITGQTDLQIQVFSGVCLGWVTQAIRGSGGNSYLVHNTALIHEGEDVGLLATLENQ
jgi:hypothetical protein